MNDEHDSKITSNFTSTQTKQSTDVDQKPKNNEKNPNLETTTQESTTTTNDKESLKKDTKARSKIHYPNGYLSRTP
jgi:hypothetical protein